MFPFPATLEGSSERKREDGLRALPVTATLTPWGFEAVTVFGNASLRPLPSMSGGRARAAPVCKRAQPVRAG